VLVPLGCTFCIAGPPVAIEIVGAAMIDRARHPLMRRGGTDHVRRDSFFSGIVGFRRDGSAGFQHSSLKITSDDRAVNKLRN
jgi:hypothetical protein